MILDDFMKIFNVHAPFYIRAMKGGTGVKAVIFTDDCIDELDNNWYDCEVVSVRPKIHRVLGPMLEIEIDVH